MSRVVRVDLETSNGNQVTRLIDGPKAKDAWVSFVLALMRSMAGEGRCDSFTVTVHQEGEGCDHE